MQRLKEAAEKGQDRAVRRHLHQHQPAYITADATGPKHLDLTLTRAKFDQLHANLVEATSGPVKQAMSDAGLSSSDISKVLMVGRLQPYPRRAGDGQEARKEASRASIDECRPSNGAPGRRVHRDVKGLLLDVTPRPGHRDHGRRMTKLIERNTTIPAKKSQVLTTAADNQTSVEVHVLQGEREMAQHNKTLGRFNLDGIAPARRGVPQIEGHSRHRRQRHRERVR